jgi:hypothetical protein
MWSTGGMITDRKNLKSSDKNPLKSLPTTKLSWTALGMNPGLRGES